MSIDLRTRVDSEQVPVEAGRFFGETLPPLLDAHQSQIAPGARGLRLADFCIEDLTSWKREIAELTGVRYAGC